MEAFVTAGSTMLIVLIVVALGYLARKIHMVNDDFDSMMSNVVMNITCPALVLDSVLGNSNLPEGSVVLQVLGVSFLLYGVTLVVALVVPMLYRIPKAQRGGHAFTIFMSNVGFMGFAVCDVILGSDSILYLAIYNIASNLLLYSVGAWMVSTTGTVELSRRERMEYMAKNLLGPTMIACVVALFLALFHVTDSGVIGNTCDFLGGMTAPAAMLVIGSTLAKYEIKTMLTNVWAYVTTFVRLIVVPVVVYFTASLFFGDPYLVATLTLIAAMPAAMVGIIMGVMYGGDLVTLSQCMFLTTTISVLTIPIIAMFVV